MQGFKGDTDTPFPLLQLPAPALDMILQKLDPCSLASTAATCSNLSHTVPASSNSIVACYNSQQSFHSHRAWLALYGTGLTSMTQISQYWISTGETPFSGLSTRARLGHLPCPQLQQLKLQGLSVQLGASRKCRGVLHSLTSLTGLSMEKCAVHNHLAALAAIAAATQLRSLSLDGIHDEDDSLVFSGVQHLTNLTHLSLSRSPEGTEAELRNPLGELSALVNLECLVLADIAFRSEFATLPPELTKLTRLHISLADYSEVGAAVVQWRYLSSSLACLTSLRDLSIELSLDCPDMDQASLSGDISQLPRLTSLTLDVFGLKFKSDSTVSSAQRPRAWFTALERLSLSQCAVQPAALAALTQLQGLALSEIWWDGATPQDLLLAVSELPILTDLQLDFSQKWVPLISVAACTALTVNTNLCTVQLGIWCEAAPQGIVLFAPGTFYPRLRQISLQYQCNNAQYMMLPNSMAMDEQQLQQLCSCCPAVETLAFALQAESSPTAFLPLLQLSALTSLEVWVLDGPLLSRQLMEPYWSEQPRTVEGQMSDLDIWDERTEALVGVAAQLTGLKQLSLRGIPLLTNPVMLQLTALKALEELTLLTRASKDSWWNVTGPMLLQNKARCGYPPDVWIQLLRYLLSDPACRQALLQRSSGAAAAPAELMLAQLAATLAEELAAAGLSVEKRVKTEASWP